MAGRTNISIIQHELAAAYSQREQTNEVIKNLKVELREAQRFHNAAQGSLADRFNKQRDLYKVNPFNVPAK